MATSIPITLALPSRYARQPETTSSAAASNTASRQATASPPPLEWLATTWTVSHSTLSMWRSARNVRISYRILPPESDGRPRLDDLVEYEPANKKGVRKTVEGIDSEVGPASWIWRGKGLLSLVRGRWEMLGWGETTTEKGIRERWIVTWFAATLFTREGFDVCCDRPSGPSPATYERLKEALEAMPVPKLAALVKSDLRPVAIQLPWTTK